jgi:hypothetical protein
MKFIIAATLLVAGTMPAFAQRGLTPDCQAAWGRYLAAPAPKAFANGASQGCGWQIKSDSYPDVAAIRAQALRQCAQFAGPTGGCKVIDQK